MFKVFSFVLLAGLVALTLTTGCSDDDDNGLGSGSVYVFDINCPGVLPELIFMDGFDLGGTNAWAVTNP